MHRNRTGARTPPAMQCNTYASRLAAGECPMPRGTAGAAVGRGPWPYRASVRPSPTSQAVAARKLAQRAAIRATQLGRGGAACIQKTRNDSGARSEASSRASGAGWGVPCVRAGFAWVLECWSQCMCIPHVPRRLAWKWTRAVLAVASVAGVSETLGPAQPSPASLLSAYRRRC